MKAARVSVERAPSTESLTHTACTTAVLASLSCLAQSAVTYTCLGNGITSRIIQ